VTPSRPLRLLHFDLKTVFSYGDQLLFEAVRATFNGFGGGDVFDLTESVPMRDPVRPRLIDRINSDFDGVVLGGGGIFPRATQAAAASGWQWNISLDMLRRLEKPIIIFGAGNAPLSSPARAKSLFARHLRETADRTVFFGLRSSGAADSIRSWLDDDHGERVTVQPCPTTLTRVLFPDLVPESISHDRRLALQFGLEDAHIASGLTPESMNPQVVRIVRELQNEGWEVECIAHKRADMNFHRAHGSELGLTAHELFRRTDLLFEGISTYARFPIVLGARGHSQMIPFGIGNIPISVSTNDKIRYFAHDMGHPEWLIDPKSPSFVEQALTAVRDVDERRVDLHRELRSLQQGFVDLTESNLATIHHRLTGVSIDAHLGACDRRQRALALSGYNESYERRQLAERLGAEREQVRSLRSELDELRKQGRPPDPRWLLARARTLAATGDLQSARNMTRTIDAVDPEFFRLHARPGWDDGIWRKLPPLAITAGWRSRRVLRRALHRVGAADADRVA
jgi:hypothetical protein